MNHRDVWQEIELGADICSKLRRMYFEDDSWSECNDKIAKKFTLLKKAVQKFHPEKNKVEILSELRKYSQEDIEHAILCV